MFETDLLTYNIDSKIAHCKNAKEKLKVLLSCKDELLQVLNWGRLEQPQFALDENNKGIMVTSNFMAGETHKKKIKDLLDIINVKIESCKLDIDIGLDNDKIEKSKKDENFFEKYKNSFFKKDINDFKSFKKYADWEINELNWFNINIVNELKTEYENTINLNKKINENASEQLINSILKELYENGIFELKFYSRDIEKQIRILNDCKEYINKNQDKYKADDYEDVCSMIAICESNKSKLNEFIQVYENNLKSKVEKHKDDNFVEAKKIVKSYKIQWLSNDSDLYYLINIIPLNVTQKEIFKEFIKNNFLDKKNKPFKQKNIGQGINNLLDNEKSKNKSKKGYLLDKILKDSYENKKLNIKKLILALIDSNFIKKIDLNYFKELISQLNL